MSLVFGATLARLAVVRRVERAAERRALDRRVAEPRVPERPAPVRADVTAFVPRLPCERPVAPLRPRRTVVVFEPRLAAVP